MTIETSTCASASNRIPVLFQKDDLVKITGEGKPVTTSLIIADKFEKQHKNVLRDIENLECSNEFSQLNFEPRDYMDERGKKYPMFLITRDGFTILAMGYTGKIAMEWKEKYIARFNELEKQHYDRQIANYPPKRIYSEMNRLTVEMIHVKDVLKNLDQVRQYENPVAGFVKKHCEVNLENRVSKNETYYTYEDYCARKGIYALHKNTFFKNLYAYGAYIKPASITVSGKRVPAVKGISLVQGGAL